MKFLFHSVYHDGHHSVYYNVYLLDGTRYFAECHHFNRQPNCVGDFELIKRESGWEAVDSRFSREAEYLGEEIDRNMGSAAM